MRKLSFKSQLDPGSFDLCNFVIGKKVIGCRGIYCGNACDMHEGVNGNVLGEVEFGIFSVGINGITFLLAISLIFVTQFQSYLSRQRILGIRRGKIMIDS